MLPVLQRLGNTYGFYSLYFQLKRCKDENYNFRDYYIMNFVHSADVLKTVVIHWNYSIQTLIFSDRLKFRPITLLDLHRKIAKTPNNNIGLFGWFVCRSLAIVK